ncbi:hypothetical protein HYZ78_03630 [Candidatus Microgenomates bacterium]|nr:hypothetical protein [Candidatus Microgenomates bacterium]
MPLATIYVKDPAKVPNLRDIAHILPDLVALNLGEPNTQADLRSDEVEVRIQVGHPFDQNTKDLGIVIFANDYPEREGNLTDRVKKLKTDVRALLMPGIEGYVWVILGTGGYAEWSAILAGRDFTTE